MNFARPSRAAALAALVAAAGCDYWTNLVEEPKPTRVGLEVQVTDAWTGLALGEARCRDSLRNLDLVPDGAGGFRIADAATGPYAIRCDHEWYYEGAADFELTKAGGRASVKLARQGLRAWYPEQEHKVAILGANGGTIRFPTNLDWRATPADTSGRFRYEWTFKRAKGLNHGQQIENDPLDSASYSPRFRPRAAAEAGVGEGKDTAILNVYSLLKGKQNAYLVGADTAYFGWVRNLPPKIAFDTNYNRRTFRVGCRISESTARPTMKWNDTDGACSSVRFWTKGPSILKMDSALSCDEVTHYFNFQLAPPVVGASGSQHGEYGAEQFENKVIAEITDDNGEKSRDTLVLISYTNSQPVVKTSILGIRGNPFVGDRLRFQVEAYDDDGYISDGFLRLRGIATDTSYSQVVNNNNSNDHVFPFSVEYTPPVSDTFEILAVAHDDCSGLGYSATRKLTVMKNTPPAISFGKPVLIKIGDDQQVEFSLTVTDRDDPDSLALVRVNWAGLGFEDTIPLSKEYRKTYRRVVPSALPEEGKREIRIHAEDSHAYGNSDTSFQIP